jgi:hypothetical protein
MLRNSTLCVDVQFVVLTGLGAVALQMLSPPCAKVPFLPPPGWPLCNKHTTYSISACGAAFVGHIMLTEIVLSLQSTIAGQSAFSTEEECTRRRRMGCLKCEQNIAHDTFVERHRRLSLQNLPTILSDEACGMFP